MNMIVAAILVAAFGAKAAVMNGVAMMTLRPAVAEITRVET